MALCGDGVVHEGVEACDDGNENQQDRCLNDCTVARCGDGVVSEWEACDDGNNVLDGATNQNPYGNGCSETCTQLGECGDGQVQYAFEDCDDGNDTDTDTCNSNCEFTRCGDGIVQEVLTVQRVM